MSDADDRAQVEDIARAVLNPRQVIVNLERAVGGLSNRTWIVTTARRGIVVRLDSATDGRLLVDRSSELAVLHVAATAGIGPKVIHSDASRGILVTELLNGSPWSLEYVRAPTAIARIAELLKQVHALSPADGIRRVDIASVVQHYWSQLRPEQRDALGGELRLHRMLDLARAIKQTERLRLCHNDVHHLNLMDDGRVRLLDWEYAGIGDRDFDLAGVCCYHDFQPEQRAQLLAHYAGSASSEHLARLEHVCVLFEYVRDLWFAVRESAGP